LQSAFYPCSIYNAVSQGDIKKIERLLKSGVNPNVKCQTKGVIADILRYIFFPLSEKGQTPLDRAIQDMKEAYNLWGSPIISNDIITLLIESGAVIEKEKIDYLPLIFEYASKEVIELFLAKGAFNGSEEQSRSIVLSALGRSAENIQEYEEIAELALSFVQSKELKQEILDRVFLYWSYSTNKMAILLKQGANINVTDENGESKLMEVLRAIPFTRNAEEIIFLIRNGIDVNIKNKHSNITALDIINRQKQKYEYDKVSSEVIEKLLYEKGAKSGAQLPK
jgi:ankyrin repeat protein